MKPVFLVDVDGVLLDWATPFAHYILNRNSWYVNPEKWDECKSKGQFRHIKKWFIGSDELLSKLIHQFSMSKYFAALGPLPHATNFLEWISETHDVVAITSCGDDPKIIKNRKENLEKVFPNVKFKNIHHVQLNGDKTPFLSQYESTFWVDDHIENIKAGIDCGHKSFWIGEGNPEIYNNDIINKIDNIGHMRNIIENISMEEEPMMEENTPLNFDDIALYVVLREDMESLNYGDKIAEHIGIAYQQIMRDFLKPSGDYKREMLDHFLSHSGDTILKWCKNDDTIFKIHGEILGEIGYGTNHGNVIIHPEYTIYDGSAKLAVKNLATGLYVLGERSVIDPIMDKMASS